MKKFLYLISASVFFFSCNIESEITKSTSAVLASDVTSIVINNSYIPIDIEGVSGDKIIFSAGGNITLYTNDKIINEPVIKISGNSALLYFQVFEDNQASFSFNSGASDKKRPWLRIQIPSSFSGELTVNNYGYNAKASIKNFPNLKAFTYLVIDSDLKTENIKGDSATFYLNSADLTGSEFEFQNTTIYAQTSCTISLSGFPGNLFVTTQNYMPFKAEYTRYNGEYIDIRTYSGGGEIILPKTASFQYDLFSTTGTILLTGFDSKSAEVDLGNKKRGTVKNGGTPGEIYYNSYTNSFSVIGK